jgi:hypothetical protein
MPEAWSITSDKSGRMRRRFVTVLHGRGTAGEQVLEVALTTMP